MEPEKETGGEDLRAALTAAFDKAEGVEPEKAEAHPETTKEATDTAATAQPEKPVSAAPAPASWTADAKAEWAKLPPRVQEEIMKREKDVARGFEEKGQEANFARAVKETLAPFRQEYTSQGMDEAGAIKFLVQMHDFAKRDPVGYISHVSQQLGVDLSKLPQLAQQRQGYVDPQVLTLQRELQELKSSLSTREQAELQSEIASFSADKPHFEEVKPLMAALLESGQAHDLQTAYDMAVYASPQTRERILSDQRKTDVQRKADEAKAKADKAKQAAVSIKGGPASPVSGAAVPNQSLRGSLEAAWEQAAGGRI